MVTYDRDTIQNLYIRVCKDSGLLLDHIKAAKLVASILKITPFEVWEAIGTFNTMEQIANGSHPVMKKETSSET